MEESKGKLHSLIETTDNEALLKDPLFEAENRLNTTTTYLGLFRNSGKVNNLFNHFFNIGNRTA